VLVLGQLGVGKSTFIDLHTNEDGTDNDLSVTKVDGVEYKVRYQDSADSSPKDQYKGKDLVMLCFAVNNVASFNKLEEEYLAEIKSDVPVLVVGTKCDLRDDPDREDMVSIPQAIEVAKKVNASAYLECSSTIKFNINALQEEIVKVIILDKQTKAKKETSNFSFGIVKFLLGR